MRATLVHNPRAGHAGSIEDIVDGLRDIGWNVARLVDKRLLDERLGLAAASGRH